MVEERAVVFVIDDDPSMRLALEDLVSTVGLEVRTFAAPQEFLQSKPSDPRGCAPCRAARAFRNSYRARAADHDARCHRAGQQAGRSGTRLERDDGEGSPRPSHAEDAREIAARAGA